jgi:hypothetical protein
VLFDSDSRGDLLRAGLKRTAMPLVVGVVIDTVVQWMLFQRVLLSAAILVGALLVGVPYIAARGLTNRILRRRFKRGLHLDRLPPDADLEISRASRKQNERID